MNAYTSAAPPAQAASSDSMRSSWAGGTSIGPALALLVATLAWAGVGAGSAFADLIVHYSFESLSGGMVGDTSGLGNHGIVHGSLALDAGVAGQAVRFDGNGYIEIPSSAGVNLGDGSQLTLIFSVRRDNALAGCYRRNIPELELFSKSDNRVVADADSGFQFLIANNSPSFYFSKGWGNQRHIEPVAPLGDWSQVVLVKDDADWTLYQDGQPLPGLDAAKGAPGIWGRGDPFVNGDFEPMNAAPMLVGAVLDYNAGAQPANLFKGWMDEISIYDEALVPSQLASLGISVTDGIPLNQLTHLLGEAPDALTSWPWDPIAQRCVGPCLCPDDLPGWSILLALLLPLALRAHAIVGHERHVLIGDHPRNGS